MKKILFCILIFISGYVQVYAQCNTALIISQGRPAFASSQESASYKPGNAFDGDRTTRWSSLASDPQYLYVDLGSVTTLCQVNIIWEAAYGKNYTIDISDDALVWTTVATITNNSSLTNNIPIVGNGRYVRMHGTVRGTPNGYSIFGMHVYGTAPSPSCSATNLALGALSISSSDENIAFPSYQAFDGNLGTRWSSMPSDPQFIYADLGAFYNLCSITLSWEAAYGKDFEIQASEDALTWSTLATFTNNTSTTNTVPVSALARYVRMYGTARATGYGYSLYEFTVHGYQVLPITLSAFNVTPKSGKFAVLQWTTNQEINNHHFTIERSTDAIHFIGIGTVKSKGNLNSQTSYSFTDSLSVPGVNKYRIKQVDANGQFTYSPVQQITLEGTSGQTNLSIYPNPTTDHLTISSENREPIKTVTVYTASGTRIIEYKNITANTFRLSVKTLEPGIYVIQAKTEHYSKSFKVIKRL